MRYNSDDALREQERVDAERQHGTPPSWNRPIITAPKSKEV